MDDCRLRRFIVPPANPTIGDETADRGDVDDPPFTAREHRAADHLRANEAMREIEIDKLPPSREVGVLDRDVDISAADIVDENVDRRPFGERAPAKVLADCGVGDISREGPGFSIALPHLVSRSGEGLRIARDKHDIRPGIRCSQRNRSAEPPAAPGDKNAFAVQPELVEHAHDAIPYRFCRLLILAVGAGLKSIRASQWRL
jgi:hypothetical protein